MRTAQLDEANSGTFDALGVAVVRIGPTRVQQYWKPSNVAVSSTSSSDTEARVYLGAATPSNLLAGSYSGNRDNAPIAQPLGFGQVLTVVWSGGTPGATATVSVSGQMEVPG